MRLFSFVPIFMEFHVLLDLRIKRTKMKNILCLVTAILLSLSLSAQNPMKTKTVSVFKNGSAFFINEGTLKTTNNTARLTEHLPEALFGTFWIYSPNSDLKAVSSFMDKVKKDFDATTAIHLLMGNIGKEVEVHTEKEKFTGKVVKVQGTFVMLNMSGKFLVINSNEIKRVEFLEMPDLKYGTEIDGRVLQIDFNSAKPSQPIEMMYLRNGIGWLPSYLVELTSDDKARITLRALLMNDAEDINNADLHFVVGVPNFMFSHLLSPLLSVQTVVQFLAQLNNQYAYNLRNQTGFLGNAITAQTLDYGINEETNFFPSGVTGSIEGTSNEDLYFYELNNITLKKGGRALYDVLREDVPIRHIYEVNLSQNNLNQGYYTTEYSFSEHTKNKVWHSIKLTNNTGKPLTTGSALVVNTQNGGKKPISQDKIKYTPVKGESFLKLTQAVDVKVTEAEKEIARQERVKVKHTTYYDLLTVEGTVKIKNYKNKAIDLNVKRSIIGLLKDSNPDWLKNTRIYPGYHGLNRINDVCWELKLKPGEEKEVKYTYQIYIYTGY